MHNKKNSEIINNPAIRYINRIRKKTPDEYKLKPKVSTIHSDIGKIQIRLDRSGFFKY